MSLLSVSKLTPSHLLWINVTPEVEWEANIDFFPEREFAKLDSEMKQI